LLFGTPETEPNLAAFLGGLRDLGYIEGKNILIEYRYAEGKPERLRELAAELVANKPDLIFALGGDVAPLARVATNTIPIVMAVSNDPVQAGLVASLAHPGGDITGVTRSLGEGTGIAVNSSAHIFVLPRGTTTGPAYAAAAAQLLEFDADGNFLREIGHQLYAWSFAHMVKVDRHDNIWVTDKGSDMVIKFTPAGRVAMVFGRKQEASDEETGPLKHPKPPLAAEPGRFRQVTDVAFDSADNAYTSDGYINSRIAKADKDGNWLKSWGERGNGPGQFTTPHAIAV